MANERYTEKAIGALAAFIEANYATAIDAIEAEQSLTAGTIPDPVDYVPTEVSADNRSPLVEVYADGWDYIDQRNGILAVDCSVVVSFIGDCDIEAGSLRLSRYVTAVLKPIQDDPTLTGAVVQCVLGGGDTIAADRVDDSTTRFALHQQVEVTIC